ncbi:hypothetical protein [Moritella sp. Urea-trap-13]|uniref:hypothetical protein n=1 Tax=Moritella sp. Urea-trap-13 TaxID=2058327 RepID=UPI000C33F26E|nr:hypothetical protein [Moritella sp. Urea-trap-13]PKH09386.1 hypothetical protein CXF93_00645 [Moritella sp. Urea-trap-13]
MNLARHDIVYKMFFLLLLILLAPVAKSMKLNRWQFGEGEPTIAWGPTIEIDNAMFNINKTSIITPYLRIFDNNVEPGLFIKGGIYQYYCERELQTKNYSDVYLIQNSNVKFAIKCIIGKRLLIYPRSTSGAKYFIRMMQLNQNVDIHHYWSDTQWKISSLGFDGIFRTMTAWNMMLEESL